MRATHHHTMSIRSAATLVLVLSTLATSAQRGTDTIATRPLEGITDMLGARLRLALPEPFEHRMRPAEPGLGSAAHVVVRVGEDRLHLVCSDLVATASKRLLEDWRMMLDPEGDSYTFRKHSGAGGIAGVLFEPTAEEDTPEGRMLVGAVLDLREGGLLRLDAYLEPAAWPRRSSYKALFKAMLDAATPGPGAVQPPKRTAHLLLPGGRDSLAISLPAGYGVLSEREGSGMLHRISMLQPLDATSRPVLLVAMGRDLGTRASRLDLSPKLRQERKGQLLRQAVTWSTYTDPDGGLMLGEHSMPLPGGAEGSVLQVAAVCQKEAELSVLLGIAETLRQVER